jgi:hypothetical protein
MYENIPDEIIALLNNPNVRSVVIDYGTATLSDGARGYSVNIVTRGPSPDARSTNYLEGPAASLYESLWPALHAAGYTRISGWLDSVRGRIEGGANYARED